MSRVKADYIPTYRKHLTTGQAVVSLNGIDRYLGRYGTVASKQAYDRLVSEWLIGGRQLPDTGDLSIAGLILAYWNAVGKRLEGGRSDNLRAVLKIVKEAYGSALVPDFGPKALKVVREKMREKNWSRGFINTQIAWVKRIFRWGASEELVSGEQVHALWSVVGVRKGTEGFREAEPVKPVALEDVEKTIPYLPLVVKTMVKIQLLCGCRPAEICRVGATDLDMSLPDLWTYSPPEHKGAHLAKQRVIYFGPRCIELLRPWLRADGKCLFSPVESEEKRNGQRKLGRSTPMTPSQRRRRRKRNRVRPWGERYSTSNYRNSIYRACRKAGIKPWGPNRLRHTRATEVRKEFGLEAAQIFLGHVRCDTTEIYAERDTRLGKEVAKKIG